MRRRSVVDRIAAALGIGDVTLLAAHAQAAVQRSAAAVLDRVAEALRRRRLADDARVDRLAARAQDRDDRGRAVDRVALFVRGQQDRDRAAAAGAHATRSAAVTIAATDALHVRGAAAIADRRRARSA